MLQHISTHTCKVQALNKLPTDRGHMVVFIVIKNKKNFYQEMHPFPNTVFDLFPILTFGVHWHNVKSFKFIGMKFYRLKTMHMLMNTSVYVFSI